MTPMMDPGREHERKRPQNPEARHAPKPPRERGRPHEHEDVPLAEVVRNGRLACPLDEAALRLARQEYPDLDLASWLSAIDALADRVRPLLSSDPAPPETIGAISDIMFRAAGFSGNETQYDSPDNSYLNVVLETRLGIPVSLAVVYHGVARRLGLHLEGTSFPGHFLLRATRPGWPILIDCYHGGKILAEDDCRARLASFGWDTWDPHVVDPVPDISVVRRMLNNLKRIYLKQRDWERLRKTVLQMFAISPQDHDELFTMGVALAGTGQHSEAVDHIERFLELRPEASNRNLAARLLEDLRAGRWNT